MKSLDKTQILVLVIIFISVFTDGIRDVNYSISLWIAWHLVKWISVYSIWLLVLYQNDMFNPKRIKTQWRLWIILAAIGIVAWQLGAMVQLPPKVIHLNSIGF